MSETKYNISLGLIQYSKNKFAILKIVTTFDALN